MIFFTRRLFPRNSAAAVSVKHAFTRTISFLTNHLQPLSEISHFGKEVVGVDLAQATLSASSSISNEIKSAVYEYGLLIFRNQHHLTPQDEMNFANMFTHQPDDVNQSYTGGAGTQHRLPDYPSIALVGTYRVKNFHGLTAESTGVYNQWHPNQRAWHCDGLADTHPPPDITTMRCLKTPSRGGETLFACSVKAAELLNISTLEAMGPSPEDVVVNYRLFGKYEIASEGTHLISASGYKGEADKGEEVNLKEGTSVPLVIRERHSGKRSLVGSYHVESISYLKDGEDHESRLEFNDANRYMSEVWRPGLAGENIYKHTWQIGDLVVWSNRLVIHTATSTSSYAGEDRLHTRIRMRSQPEDAPVAWKA